MKRVLFVVATGLALSMAGAAPGVAALPHGNATYQTAKPAVHMTIYTYSQHKIRPDYYNACNSATLSYFLHVHPNGKFAFTGSKTNIATNQKVHVDIQGSFVSKSVAKGTVRYTTGTCHAKAQTFKVVLAK
jgi:hypothetical protein